MFRSEPQFSRLHRLSMMAFLLLTMAAGVLALTEHDPLREGSSADKIELTFLSSDWTHDQVQEHSRLHGDSGFVYVPEYQHQYADKADCDAAGTGAIDAFVVAGEMRHDEREKGTYRH